MASRRPDTAGSGQRLVAAAAVLLAAAASACLAQGEGAGSTAAMFTSTAQAVVRVGSAAPCAAGTPYADHVSAMTPAPAFWWRFETAAGDTVVPDHSGNGNDGTATPAGPTDGLTFGTVGSGLVQCDTTAAVSQRGAVGDTGAVVLPVQRTSPTTFSLTLWVRSDPGASGRLLGFGDAATGGSTQQDRAVALDATGLVTFTVSTAGGPLVLTSVQPLTDARPHLVAVTSTGATLRLYVDGAQVDAASSVAWAPGYLGYWRTGYDALGGPTPEQAAAAVDEVAVWEGQALSAPEVAALAAADHW